MRALATAILALAVVAPGCGRPPDEAWLRFLGFQSTSGSGESAVSSNISSIEGNLFDGTAMTVDAVFRNVSTIVGSNDGSIGTGILVKSARVDYKMSGYAPPSAEYPLNLYLGPSSHTNGTTNAGGTTTSEGTLTDFPIVTASLKQWLRNTGAFNNSSATPTVKLTADVTFFAETDEGTELEVHGSITILLSTSGGPSGTGMPTVAIEATTATATTSVPGKFTITRSGSTTNSLTVSYTVGGTADPGLDYETLPGSVVISVGSSSSSISVTPKSGYTSGTTVTVTLSDGSAYNLGSSSDTVTITD
jgi:hypothetical protein